MVTSSSVSFHESALRGKVSGQSVMEATRCPLSSILSLKLTPTLDK